VNLRRPGLGVFRPPDRHGHPPHRDFRGLVAEILRRARNSLRGHRAAHLPRGRYEPASTQAPGNLISHHRHAPHVRRTRAGPAGSFVSLPTVDSNPMAKKALNLVSNSATNTESSRVPVHPLPSVWAGPKSVYPQFGLSASRLRVMVNAGEIPGGDKGHCGGRILTDSHDRSHRLHVSHPIRTPTRPHLTR